MATFLLTGTIRSLGTQYYKFHFINHSTTILLYDFRGLTNGENPIYGSIGKGQSFVTPTITGGIFQAGNISSLIALFAGIPNPSFRFWSGTGGLAREDQYINLLGVNGYTVTKDTSEISEITGHGARITVDGGGVNNPSILDIYIQAYNA